MSSQVTAPATSRISAAELDSFNGKIDEIESAASSGGDVPEVCNEMKQLLLDTFGDPRMGDPPPDEITAGVE